MSNGGDPTLAWQGPTAIVARWTGTTWSQYVNPQAGSYAIGLALDPSGAPYLPQYVSIDDPSFAYTQLHVLRWNAVWSEVGPTSLGLDAYRNETDRATLAIAGNGSPFIAWASNRSVYVKTYNGAAWVELGGSASNFGLSDAVAIGIIDVAIALTDQGVPIVAWINRASGPNATNIDLLYVKRWTGSTWEGYGGSGSGLGLGTASKASLATDGQRPIVAYRSGVDVIVKAWDRSHWINLVSGAEDSAALATATGIDRPSVVVPRPDTIVVSYRQNETGGGRIWAKYMEDGTWRALGDSGGALSTSDTTFFGLTAAANGGRACTAWRQGNPTSAYIACAKF